MFSSTALILTAFALGAAIDLPSPLLVTYWGQGPNSSLQKPLRSYCDSGYNVVVLGFINQFGNDTFNMQMDSVSCSTDDTSGCAAIKSNITYCQNKGVKVLMSMGGATVRDCGESCKGEYRFDSVNEANQTAEKMYNLFFSGTDNKRPFGSVELDGVDLDIEDVGEQNFYDKFVAKIRELQGTKDLIVSAAPECHHGCPLNCNPLEQTVNLTDFDYLFVQFYNDQTCSLLESGFNSSLDYWLSLQGPSSDTLIVLGVPGDNEPWDVTDPKYFVQAEQVVSIYKDKHVQNERVAGIGIWQASSNTNEPEFFPVIQEGLGLPENLTTVSVPTPTSSSLSPTTTKSPLTTTHSRSSATKTPNPSFEEIRLSRVYAIISTALSVLLL